jgi:hypothetical protein
MNGESAEYIVVFFLHLAPVSRARGLRKLYVPILIEGRGKRVSSQARSVGHTRRIESLDIEAPCLPRIIARLHYSRLSPSRESRP